MWQLSKTYSQLIPFCSHLQFALPSYSARGLCTYEHLHPLVVVTVVCKYRNLHCVGGTRWWSCSKSGRYVEDNRSEPKLPATYVRTSWLLAYWIPFPPFTNLLSRRPAPFCTDRESWQRKKESAPHLYQQNPSDGQSPLHHKTARTQGLRCGFRCTSEAGFSKTIHESHLLLTVPCSDVVSASSKAGMRRGYNAACTTVTPPFLSTREQTCSTRIYPRGTWP